jgi:hypothetical protein
MITPLDQIVAALEGAHGTNAERIGIAVLQCEDILRENFNNNQRVATHFVAAIFYINNMERTLQ